jgi:predicted nucleic acid-binding protein
VPEKLLLDTDVIIEYLRGRPEAVRYLQGLEGTLLISAITVAELYVGVRGGSEERQLEQFLLAFDVVPISGDIGRIGGLFRRDYGRSHGVGLADALIGATAQEQQATLVTFNSRHYPMLIEVRVPYARG